MAAERTVGQVLVTQQQIPPNECALGMNVLWAWDRVVGREKGPMCMPSGAGVRWERPGRQQATFQGGVSKGRAFCMADLLNGE